MKKLFFLFSFLVTVSLVAHDLEQYEHAVACNPEDYRALYNVGVAAFKQDDLVKAKAAFDCLKPVCEEQNWDSGRCEKINYNAGNTEMKTQKFADAVESFETVLRHNSDNEKAREKLELAKKMLEQQEQEQQKDDDKGDDQESGDQSDQEKQEKDGHQDNGDGDSDKPDDGDQGERNDDPDSRDDAQQDYDKKNGQDDQSHKQPENQEDNDGNSTQQDQPNPNDSDGQEQEENAGEGNNKEPELTQEEQRLLAGLEVLDHDMNKKQAERTLRAVVGGRSEKNW